MAAKDTQKQEPVSLRSASVGNFSHPSPLLTHTHSHSNRPSVSVIDRINGEDEPKPKRKDSQRGHGRKQHLLNLSDRNEEGIQLLEGGDNIIIVNKPNKKKTDMRYERYENMLWFDRGRKYRFLPWSTPQL